LDVALLVERRLWGDVGLKSFEEGKEGAWPTIGKI
jgi:hypothetical protein